MTEGPAILGHPEPLLDSNNRRRMPHASGGRGYFALVEHRSDQPVQLFPLDGRPHLAHVRVETTDVASYQVLLGEVTP